MLVLGAFFCGLLILGSLTSAAQPLSPILTNNTAYQRQLWFWNQRAYPLGYIPTGARSAAVNQIAQVTAQTRLAGAGGPAAPQPNGGGPPPPAGNFWVNIGPAPIIGGQVSPPQAVSGRIQSIAVNPSNPNHWLVGAAQGGVWSTTDAGTTWTPLTDDQASLAMGAIAFAPSSPSTVYAGTGEGDLCSGDSYAGMGLLKSTDGGSTWQLLASSTFAKTSFSHLKVSTTDPNTLVATTTWGWAGRVPSLPPNRPPTGILKSTDGGVTWSVELKGQATGLDVNPADFSMQYAALGFFIGDPANGVYRSTDTGTTWTLIQGPWSNSNNVGRIEVAVSPSSTATLYVSIEDSFTSSSLGVWRTDNAWDATPTWTLLPPIPAPGNQFCYDHVLLVDLTNPNVLYLGETPLWKFDGTAWTAIGGNYDQNVNGIKIHPDQHALVWAGSTLIDGNDGGVWTTTDGGATFVHHNTTLAITQFYEGSIHPGTRDLAIGGSQDNGTELWTGTNGWQWIFPGDGIDNAISVNRPDTDWAVSFQGLNIFRTEDAGSTFIFAGNGIDQSFAPFVGRFEECPANSDIFIAGTIQLWRCDNFFSSASPTWSANSPALSSFASITAIAFAPSDTTGNTYAFGAEDGTLRMSSDGGNNWKDLDPANGVPNRAVTGMAFNPNDPNVVYVTLSGFDEGTPSQPGHLFVSTNALSASPSWVNISTPINIPHNTIVVDPQDSKTLYVGTDLAVWKSGDGGSSWTFLGPSTGLPNVAVFELKINRVNNRLAAFTHGRSAFTLSLANPANPQADVFVTMRANPNPLVLGGNLTYTITAGNNGPLTATNTIVTQILPDNVLFVSANSTRGIVVVSGNQISCNLGDMAAGATATITVVVTPQAAATYISTASIHSDTIDLQLFNNTATTISRVIPPTADVGIGLRGAPNPVFIGGTLTYTVSVTNNGPSAATGIVASNSLPASVGILSASAAQGITIINGNVVLFNVGSLASGAHTTATIVVTPGTQGTIVANATVFADQPDPVPGNNRASATTFVSPASDLAVSFLSAPASVVLGSNITYKILAINLGPSAASSVVLNETLPLGTTLVSSNTTFGTFTVTNGTISCNIGSLSFGGTVTNTFVLATTNAGTVSFTATVSGSQADPVPTNNTATATTVVAPPFVSIAPAGATLIAESYSPPNGAVDIGETVTMQLRLQNVGNIPTANLRATLLATNGVVSPSPTNAVSYGNLLPGATASGSLPFTFTATGTSGGSVTATLQLQDAATNNRGTAAFTFALPVVVSFANTNPISIPDSGAATPYPSTITVSGVTGLVGKVTATLSNFTHTYPHDVNVLLVGPTGSKALVMAHAAEFSSADNVTLTFDDSAAFPLPASGQLASGSWQPAAYGDTPVFPDPAPAGPYGSALSVFANFDPNGVWSLYVLDDSPGDQGNIAGGWSLAVTTITPVRQLADLILTSTASPNPVLAGANLTYSFIITNAGPNNASSVVFTDALPANVSLVSATSSQGSVSLNGNLITGNLNSIIAGSNATVSIVLTPSLAAAGLLTNSANVTAFETDLNPNNNFATTVTTVSLAADLALGQSAAPNPVLVGSNVTFTVAVTNNGPNTALNVVVTDPLPPGLGPTSANSSMGSASIAASTVTWNLGNLAAGNHATISIVAAALTAAVVTNTATATTTSVDTNTVNNSASAVVTIANPTPLIVPVSARVIAESFSPPNGTVDPGETVTVALTLANTGAADTTNLVATLQPSGGIAQISSGQATYGHLVRHGPSASANFTFTASVTNGSALTLTLLLQDGSSSLGVVNFTLGTTTFANPAAIIIPDHGPATPYPSSINVVGWPGLVSKLTLTLSGVTHSFPDDIGVLVVGPTGQQVVLMNDTGGGHSISNLTLTFDDGAGQSLPASGQILSGTYKPTTYNANNVFPATPPGPVATALAAFNGTNPNGAWSLYVFDDSPGDSGSIANGWSLKLSPAPAQLSGTISNRLFLLNLAGQPGLAYVIQASPDLVSWTPVATNVTAADGTLQFTDTNTANFRARFYRAFLAQ